MKKLIWKQIDTNQDYETYVAEVTGGVLLRECWTSKYRTMVFIPNAKITDFFLK